MVSKPKLAYELTRRLAQARFVIESFWKIPQLNLGDKVGQHLI